MGCFTFSKKVERDSPNIDRETPWGSLPLPGQSSLPGPQTSSGTRRVDKPRRSKDLDFHFTHASAFDVVKQKAADALDYAIKARNHSLGLQDPSVTIESFAGRNGEVVDVRWKSDIAEIVLAFHAPADLLESSNKASESVAAHARCLERLQSLKYAGVPVQVHPTIARVLDDLLVADGMQRLLSFLGGKSPRRVVCTGLNAGGALAVAASVVMAVEFPGADLRCVTLNSPIISYGNVAFSWVYRLMVGFSYHLTTECDAYNEICPCGATPHKEEHPPSPFSDPSVLYGHWTISKLDSPELAEKASYHPEQLGTENLMRLVSSGHLMESLPSDLSSLQALHRLDSKHKASPDKKLGATRADSMRVSAATGATNSSPEGPLAALAEDEDFVAEGSAPSGGLSDVSRGSGEGKVLCDSDEDTVVARPPVTPQSKRYQSEQGNQSQRDHSEAGSEPSPRTPAAKRMRVLVASLNSVAALNQKRLARKLDSSGRGAGAGAPAAPPKKGWSLVRKDQSMDEEDRGVDMNMLANKLTESTRAECQKRDRGPSTPRKQQSHLDDHYDLSLDWTDAPTHNIFRKLDTIEKLLISGKKLLPVANMAKAAYASGEDFRDCTNVGHSVFVNRDQKGQKDGQAHVAWRPAINTLIVAFRGTSSSADMFVDARFSPTSASFLDSLITGARVHRGFHDQLKDMWEDLEAAIDDVREAASQKASVEHIIVTGHSLGGALATIGGPLLAKKFPKADVRVVTFAAPRAGNEKFAAAFESLIGTSLRFHFNYDPVPCAPFGYKHVNNCVYLKPTNIKKPLEGVDKGAKFLLHGNRPHTISACLRAVSFETAIANHGRSLVFTWNGGCSASSM
eukprot:jgi/Botrbrau1/5180/Bobra.0172s0050.2